MNKKGTVVFDLWETLIFGTQDSAISIFYKQLTNEEIRGENIKDCMLIKETEPRLFLEQFLTQVTPSNLSSVLVSIKDPRSPLFEKTVQRFQAAIDRDSQEVRWLPGAIDLLTVLKEKYHLVLVSNLWAYQKKYLHENLKLNQYFDQCLFSCDVGVGKNNVLQNLAQYIPGLDLNHAVYIGKSYEHDIIPAVNAHLVTLRLENENNIILPNKMEAIIDQELGGEPLANSQEKALSKVLCVIPPYYKLLGSHNNRLNLGASYLSACLTEKGYTNKIYHCDAADSEVYPTRFQMVFNSVNFWDELENNPAYSEFAEYYKNNQFDVVFVTAGDILNSTLDSGNWESAKKIAKIVRIINPQAHIVAFGPEISTDNEDFDLIVDGEIENVIYGIVDKRVRGKLKGGLYPEKAMATLPVFDIKAMVNKIPNKSLDTVLWRRGCRGTCDFCAIATTNKGSVRFRPMKDVFEEIRLRYDDYGIRNFYLVDHDFSSDKEISMEFCKRLRDEVPPIIWRTESRFDNLDEELLREMKKAGCTHVKLGLENALDPKYQTKSKRVNIKTAEQWIRKTQDEIGIGCIIYLMLGGRWLTRSQYQQMFENTKNLKAAGYTVSLYTPYPNTASGITKEEWMKRQFTASHLDIRLIDFWRIPLDIIEKFFTLEVQKGREDNKDRTFKEIQQNEDILKELSNIK